ncbi:hypothetical protein PMU79_04430 [Enterococcus durans]|uniref:hypothetical protein n=1 Tax=Enterococcus sp. BSD2780061688st2 D3 TaxID=2559707 RepID=UPI001105B3AC|nr:MULTISPECIES: hypothetical protein [Enterococcus]MDB1678830.1 hypothetical protein [Enterococcus durans]
MPFIVYFFVLLLTLYIPLPTLLLLIHRLSYQHDTITMLSKGFLLLFVFLDYKFSFYCIYNCRVKKRYYWYLTLANLFEFFVHLYLLFTYRTVYLSLICLIQFLLLACMLFFPLSKKFRNTLFT